MEAILLTIDEVAQLEGSNYQAIKKKVQRNKLQATKVPSTTGKGHGFEYRISYKELSEKAQARYLKEQGKAVSEPKQTPVEKYEGKTLEDLTRKQREQVNFWIKVIEEWRQYIGHSHGKKTEKTREFIEQYNRKNPKRTITERTLYAKRKIYQNYGEVALADGRADRPDKGRTSIPEVAWSVFLQWWLDEAQPTVTHTHRLVNAWAEMDMPELLPIPSIDSFYREIKKIPAPVLSFFREGKKALDDDILPYIRRVYDWLDSNDIWCSDYHTLDFFVRCDWTGKVYRPHVVVWLDIRSRKILGLHLCETSNSDGVIISFRKAVKQFGIPGQVYLDNGKEYLVHDFGGRGRRKTAEGANFGEAILDRLGVEMVNAKPKNARAKIVERAFRIFIDEFSKLIKTYCGGRPEQKPERTESTLKNINNIPLASAIAKELQVYIEGWYNHQESKAEGLNGMTRNQCYQQNLLKKRTATEEQLNLMLLRSTRSQKVKRNGVVLKFNDVELWYYHQDLINLYFGQQVYLRYDPENLATVRIYDEEEKFLVVAELLDTGGYGGETDKEVIKKISRLVKDHKGFIKGYMDKLEDVQIAPEAKEILLRKAQQNIEQDTMEYEAKVLEPVMFNTRPALEKAVGDDDIVSLDRMVATVTSIESKKKKGE